MKHKEVITDPAQLERIKHMFATYSIDDAFNFDLSPNKEIIDFIRNGSLYSLQYCHGKLQRVIIEPT